MKQVSGRELARILQRRGWILPGFTVAHHIFTMPGRREGIVIPLHGNRFVEKGIAFAR